MSYLFASDLHGSAYYAEKVIEKFEASGAEKLILLGDILYHGPRNDLPKGHDPKKVFALLNRYADRIIAVRGNCDAEIDQMVLDFPLTADYSHMMIEGKEFFLTHGHIYSPENMPRLPEGAVFVFGHIHLPVAEKKEGVTILNPGSASLPKEGNPNSYALHDGGVFTIRTFDDDVIKSIEV